jgi:DNA repair protein RadD
MFKMRDYQAGAVEAAKTWMSKTIEPAVMELATGAGKSIIAAYIAAWLTSKTDKKVLVLQPTKELTEQNREKYLALGEPCSVWCASIGKDLRHDVIFGTPKSVSNSIDKFSGNIAAVIIDECHRIDETTQNIVYALREKYKSLRVIGITATPYRLDTGYIYKYNEKGKSVHEEEMPFFHSLIYKVTPWDLINRDYLTRPVTEARTGYSVEGVNRNIQSALDKAVEGQGRKTSIIVDEIVSMAEDRQGVVIFAATIRHAEEVMDSLPPHLSEIITGKTKKHEREAIIKRFKNRQFKYLVNVAVLTTGFDAPHIDVVAILRSSSSASLFQQMVGRGLRLSEGKNDCLILDYAQNIDEHCPDGDIFNPKIKPPGKAGEGEPISAICIDCGYENEFKARPNPDKMAINEFGYFVALDGYELEMPAHFGRRCQGYKIINGESEQCAYRWTTKECPECSHQNDITARVCESCDEELIDPNEKLQIEFQKLKKDPFSKTTDKVLSWSAVEHQSQAGNTTLKVTYRTEYRTFQVWYLPRKRQLWNDLSLAVFGKIAPDVQRFVRALNNGRGEMPKTITVKRDHKSNFYNVYAHNLPEDKQP